jgi:hypothetical protein
MPYGPYGPGPWSWGWMIGGWIMMLVFEQFEEMKRTLG